MTFQAKDSPSSIEKQIEKQQVIYQEELKKGSVFSVRKAIREKIKELKRVLEQMMNRH